MRIFVKEHQSKHNIMVKTKYNTFVEAFDHFTFDYVVIPLFLADLGASGVYNVKDGVSQTELAKHAL